MYVSLTVPRKLPSWPVAGKAAISAPAAQARHSPLNFPLNRMRDIPHPNILRRTPRQGNQTVKGVG
ncbi:hypothetical protein [Chelativorans alearense]|uniref:hypothetical protein n=1 Tax=Chelativorans alearense TaxID=2681495 RepID=UPI001FE5DEBD|nr:hypothetical protein [Chelativorans alearense]